MIRWRLPLLASLVPLSLGVVLGACESKEPAETTYFERSIAPILTTSCVRTATGAGCHVASAKGYAFGNLDTSNFEGVDRRRELLANYGPYGMNAFLLKVVEPRELELRSFDGTKANVRTDIRHSGGSLLNPSATAFLTLRKWIDNGATINNSGAPPKTDTRTPCNELVQQEEGFVRDIDPPRPDFITFKNRVAPVLEASCAAGNCHGSSANQLYLTCSKTAEQIRWNYFAARGFLASTAEASELLRQPLAPSQGGTYHEGGVIFESASNESYKAVREWAEEHGPPDTTGMDPNFLFFAHRVQPVLAEKGCMMLQCHSATLFHDYRLRGGSGGSFSLAATRKNYQLSLAQLAIESENINTSRLVRKNLFRPETFSGGGGIAHRGGALLEDFPGKSAVPSDCDPTVDYETIDLNDPKAKPYCVLKEWHRRERASRALAPLSGIVYVRRPLSSTTGRVQDFDDFRGGAELRRVQASYDASGTVALGSDTALNAGCGLPAGADIRRPAVSWDGKLVAFAARPTAADPLAVYQMNADGTNCQRHADINAGPTSGNGLLVHNFDPAFSPPDSNGVVRIVFASTRGNIMGGPYDYSGPTRTPSDPSKPNSNLYSYAPGESIRQLTYLLNAEREPTFMSDGRVIFTAEKRSKDFYQLALRRINLDGGDYHPLFGQRASVGFHEASRVAELADKNFAAIFNEPGMPHGGGTLGVFNRSLGIDFTSNQPADYTLDPSVIDPAAPASPDPNFFLHSLHIVDPSVAGKPNLATTGLYCTPAPLPDGKILVSFGSATNTSSFDGDYDLYAVDAVSGTKTKLLGAAGAAEVDAVATYGRRPRGVFSSTPDEPNAHTEIRAGRGEADILVHDARVLVTLLFQNTPTGRPLEDGMTYFELFEELPPTPEVASYAQGGANVVSDAFGQTYVRRRYLGKVPLAPDGSTHFQIPGGVPLQIKLQETDLSRQRHWPRLQRESIFFAPGEYARQSFRMELFNSNCGHCHGSLSGRPLDLAVRPDVISEASNTLSRGSQPYNLNLPVNQRGSIEGP